MEEDGSVGSGEVVVGGVRRSIREAGDVAGTGDVKVQPVGRGEFGKVVAPEDTGGAGEELVLGKAAVAGVVAGKVVAGASREGKSVLGTVAGGVVGEVHAEGTGEQEALGVVF